MVVPWLLLVVYTQADERKAAIESVNDDAMRLIRIVTSNQAAQIEAARQVLTAFARLPQINTKDAPACNAFLAEMLQAYPLYLNIAVADPNGGVVCSALPFRTPINVADRAYFKMALQMHDFAVGDYQIGRITKLPAISYAYPLLDRSGQLEGVVFAVQSLSWLTAALSNVAFPAGAILMVKTAVADQYPLGRRRVLGLGRPDPLAVRPEPEQRAQADPDGQRDVVAQVVGQAQHVVGEADAGQLDGQAHAVEREEDDRLAVDLGARPVPEGPPPVAREGEGGRHGGRDHIRGERPDAKPDVQQVRAAVGDDEADQPDNAELRQLVDQVLEPLIELAGEAHLAAFRVPGVTPAAAGGPAGRCEGDASEATAWREPERAARPKLAARQPRQRTVSVPEPVSGKPGRNRQMRQVASMECVIPEPSSEPAS
jgi:hypothetical protein